MFQSKMQRYIIASPADVDSIIEMVYKAPSLGGFRGVTSIYKVLTKSYIGITRAQVRNLLPRMEVYRVRQKPRPREITPQLADEPKPLSHVKMDLVDMSSVATSNSNYNWLLNIVDMHSRFAWAIPLKSKHARLVAHELLRWTYVEGVPNIIGCDQGKEFYGEVLELSKRLGFKLAKSKPYSSSTQGLVEVFNRTLRGMLSKATDERDSKKWLPLLHHTVGAYNRIKHSSHGMAPIEVMRGRQHVQVLDYEIARRLKLNANKMVRMVNRKNKKRIGDTEFGKSNSEKGGANAIHEGDMVRILLKSMREVKAKGDMAMKAAQKKKGIGGRKYTLELYKVSKIRKVIEEKELKKVEWRYVLEGMQEQFLANELLKVHDNTIPKAGKKGAIDENYGMSSSIAEVNRASMNDDVGKIADMTDSKIREMEKLREEAEQATGSIASRVREKNNSAIAAAEQISVLPPGGGQNQVTQKSLLMKDYDARLLNKKIYLPGRHVQRPGKAVYIIVKKGLRSLCIIQYKLVRQASKRPPFMLIYY